MIFKRFRFYIYLVNNYTRAYKCRIYSACFVNVTVNFNRAVMYGKVPDTCSIKDICGFFAAACPDDDLAFTSCQKLLSGSFFHQSALVNDAVIGSDLCKLIKDMTGNYKCDTILIQVQQHFSELVDTLRIKTVQRFIKHQQLGTVYQRHSDTEPLFHSVREFCCFFLSGTGQSHKRKHFHYAFIIFDTAL